MLNKDILGRELNEKDIVVVKGSGGYDTKAKKMEVGIVVNGNIKTMTTLKGGRRPTDIFLVENPSDKEIEIKVKILDALDAINNKKTKEKKDLVLVKGDILGGLYEDGRKDLKIYLGNLNVKKFENGVFFEEFSGHLYINCGCVRESGEMYFYKDLSEKDLFSWGLSSYDFIKNKSNFRKYHKTIECFNSYDKITKLNIKNVIQKTIGSKDSEEFEYTYEIKQN